MKPLEEYGMYHINIDIGKDNIKLCDEVIININTLYIDSKIERIYK